MVKILTLIVTLSVMGLSLASCLSDNHQPPGAGLSDGLKQMNDTGQL